MGDERDSEDEQKPPQRVPVVVLLHGTDETMFDGEFVQQNDGSRSWLDLSDKEGFLLLFPQSRGMWADLRVRSLRTLWTAQFVDNNTSTTS